MSEKAADLQSSLPTTARFFTLGLVTAWYPSNIALLLLNKYLLSSYGFKYPIFLTMCHMVVCSVLSFVAIAWLKLVPVQSVRSRVQFLKISALSLVFCGSVVSDNICLQSLRYLPVSFNQAVGANTPFFTVVFACIMTPRRESWITYASLVPVVAGVIVSSGAETSFHLIGFINVCIGATAARAFRTVLQGILMSSEEEKLSSVNLLLYMSPIAVILILPAIMIMEKNVISVTLELAREDFKYTGALTHHVLGNAKGAVAVGILILIFRNPVSFTLQLI